MDKKEYLKEYLNNGKDKTKKKKKRIRTNNKGLKIIDDDAVNFTTAVKEDLLGESEDAPQIVEIIDDRPPSLQIDEKTNTHLWIPIGKVEPDTELQNPINMKFKIELGKKRTEAKKNRKDETENVLQVKQEPNSEVVVKQERVTPERSQPSENPDVSPPRRVTRVSDRDISPPRKNSDLSPPRNVKRDSDGDISPPRRKNGDLSPPRKRKHNSSPPRKPKHDTSPPRRRHHDHSPKSKRRKDLTPPRNRKHDATPPRLRKHKSPPRKPKTGKEVSCKMTKTLEGKTAGLQNAKELVKETSEIKRKEDELFRNMPTEMSGVNAETILRDRKTGMKRNLEEEATKDLEKQKRDEEQKAKYSRWGRGLKQVEDAVARREQELEEMSKPLARYADDEDLERYLKEQEREGDPMLAYIRKKKKKKNIEEGKPLKPEYLGEFMPNRFGIRPGHRWDGVDRSNGYEKKWFEIQNSRVAQQDESYKWSTEDM